MIRLNLSKISFKSDNSIARFMAFFIWTRYKYKSKGFEPSLRKTSICTSAPLWQVQFQSFSYSSS